MAYAGRETQKETLEKIAIQMEWERKSFDSHWSDISQFIMPRRSRWFVSDANKGDARNHKIVDGTATYAFRTLTSGLMSGVTSPARPWFSLGIRGMRIEEPGPVANWLHETTAIMRTFLDRSNFYQELPGYYTDLGGFGTACIYVEEEEERGARYEVIPIGSYAISTGWNGLVNGLTRTFQLTVRQLRDHFGEENLSDAIKSRIRENHWEDWVEIRHTVLPNEDYDPQKLDQQSKRFMSYYYELSLMPRDGNIAYTQSVHKDKNKFLRKGGYDQFPFFVARWHRLGSDLYGTNCPGMAVLGDVKELQLARRRLMQAIDKKVNPPLIGPSSMKNAAISILPGHTTYADIREGMQGLRPVHEVTFETRELSDEMERIRERIRIGTFENLFLMMSMSDRREITAREIDERHEEKLWALGPVMEGLNEDFLDPNTEWVFNTLMKNGELPPPPGELGGSELKVEYISVMARAMKMVDISSVDRFMTFVANLMSTTQDPSILDKIDVDQVIDAYASMTGVPPTLLRSDEDTAKIREQRAQVAQQQQQLQVAEQMAKVAKDASQADLSGENALTQALEGAGG